MTKFEFKGWDWTELLPLVGMEEEYKREVDDAEPKDCFEAEEAFGKRMSEKIRLYCHEHTEEETKEFIGHLRAYLQKVVEHELEQGYYEPYYQGILNTEHDEVFLQAYALNLTGMWT